MVLEHPAVDGPQGSLFFFGWRFIFRSWKWGKILTFRKVACFFRPITDHYCSVCVCVWWWQDKHTNAQTRRFGDGRSNAVIDAALCVFSPEMKGREA